MPTIKGQYATAAEYEAYCRNRDLETDTIVDSVDADGPVEDEDEVEVFDEATEVIVDEADPVVDIGAEGEQPADEA